MELFILNMSLSVIFLTLSHPLSLGLMLLIQTIIISLITGNFNYNYWFSYILFLILIGGMLILFIYMTSVASNEKFKFNTMSTLPLISLMSMFIIPNYFMYNFNINTINNESTTYFNNSIINMSMNKYINFPMNIILTFMIIYLFLSLIAVVKITNLKYGPLRQMN
uniref:NADH-ubiquinone oxidoreductase chain 6 n=1 Tax=Tenebrionoidea sp. 12 KM-2017 TaxID=2219467 RepID=A0A346RIK1_9CUCU|nr:NADH dehydrogenase subunit 6 [Tenebrionoidea sp. 12 KM-2017]